MSRGHGRRVAAARVLCFLVGVTLLVFAPMLLYGVGLRYGERYPEPVFLVTDVIGAVLLFAIGVLALVTQGQVKTVPRSARYRMMNLAITGFGPVALFTLDGGVLVLGNALLLWAPFAAVLVGAAFMIPDASAI